MWPSSPRSPSSLVPRAPSLLPDMEFVMVSASNLAQLAQYHLKECGLSAIRTRFSQFAGNQYLLFEVVCRGLWRYTISGGAELAPKYLQPQNYRLNSRKPNRRNAAFMTDPKKSRKKWRFLITLYDCKTAGRSQGEVDDDTLTIRTGWSCAWM